MILVGCLRGKKNLLCVIAGSGICLQLLQKCRARQNTWGTLCSRSCLFIHGLCERRVVSLGLVTVFHCKEKKGSELSKYSSSTWGHCKHLFVSKCAWPCGRRSKDWVLLQIMWWRFYHRSIQADGSCTASGWQTFQSHFEQQWLKPNLQHQETKQ